jgi:hypothetical protein
MPRSCFALAARAAGSFAPAHAAELAGDCKPVFAAIEKTLRANHTTTSVHGAETIRGTPVANDATHTVIDDGTQGTRIALAKSTGLAVSVENPNPGDPCSDLVTRYGHSGVKAPM